MPDVKIRKFLTIVEEIYHEGGKPVAKPLKRGRSSRSSRTRSRAAIMRKSPVS